LAKTARRHHEGMTSPAVFCIFSQLFLRDAHSGIS
jgi:hypothetical protein